MKKDRRSNSCNSDTSSGGLVTDDSMKESLSKTSNDGDEGAKTVDRANEEYLCVIHVDGPLGALVAQAQAKRKRV